MSRPSARVFAVVVELHGVIQRQDAVHGDGEVPFCEVWRKTSAHTQLALNQFVCGNIGFCVQERFQHIVINSLKRDNANTGKDKQSQTINSIFSTIICKLCEMSSPYLAGSIGTYWTTYSSVTPAKEPRTGGLSSAIEHSYCNLKLLSVV